MNGRYFLLALLFAPAVGCGQTNGNHHDTVDGTDAPEGTTDGSVVASTSADSGADGTSASATGTGGSIGDSANTGGADQETTTTSNGTSSAGGTGGAGTKNASSTVGGAGSKGDAGASGDLDCSGSFGEPELLFYDENERTESLAPTGDELELFYVQSNADASVRRVAVRARTSASETFGDASFPQGLADVCGSDRVDSVDISEDGLSLYVACIQQDLEEPATLRLAKRATRAEAFVVSAQSFGRVWHSISIGTDQLSLYAQPASANAPVVSRRLSTSDPFPAAEAVEIAGWLGNPDVNHSGLEIYGTVTNETTSLPQLVVAKRPATNLPFSEPTTAGLPEVSAASPAISADCQTLYFVRVVADGGKPSYLAEIAQR